MAEGGKKTKESLEEMKSILRRRIDEIRQEKNYDHFMIAEMVERRVGVGNLEIYLDQFKKNFRDCANRTPEKKPPIKKDKDGKPKVEKPDPTLTKIRILTKERDPITPPKRRKK